MSTSRNRPARLPAIVFAALLAGFTPARATVGFACTVKDKAVKAELSGAFGMSLGSSLANFGADLELLQAGLPADIRKLKLDSNHVTQSWFVGPTLNVMTVWRQEKPFREVVFIIETRRGRNEDSPYRGRYTLNIDVDATELGTEPKRFDGGGPASCVIGS